MAPRMQTVKKFFTICMRGARANAMAGKSSLFTANESVTSNLCKHYSTLCLEYMCGVLTLVGLLSGRRVLRALGLSKYASHPERDMPGTSLVATDTYSTGIPLSMVAAARATEKNKPNVWPRVNI